ncbi:MAG: hypothetical protein WD770_05445, partial [Actinomycetota bacterium]
ASTAPFWILAAALGGLAAFFLVRPFLQDLPAYRPRRGSRAFDYWPLVLGAFVPYAWALRAALRGMRLRPAVLLGTTGLVLAAFVPAPAQQSQDVYQYLIYGEMALHGVSPLAVPPYLFGSPWLAYSAFQSTPSVYGPVWTALSAAVVWMGGSLMGAFLVMKALAAALGVAAAAGLARSAGDGPAWLTPTVSVVAFGLNPLVVVSTGLGAHADVAIAAAFAWAIVAERRGRPAATTALLAAAALVKPYAGIALVVWLIALWKRRGAPAVLLHAGACAVLATGSFAPYWEGADTFRGLARIGGNVSSSIVGTLVRLISGVHDATAGSTTAGTVGRVVAATILLAALVGIARSPRTAGEPWRAAALVSVVYVLVTPWYLYWHLLGALALVVASAEPALVAGTLTFSGSSLIVAGASQTRFGSAGSLLQLALRYGPPLAASRWAARRYTAPRADHDPGGHDGRLRRRDGAPRGARAPGGAGDA